jgi:uncharacterized membrane protein YkoI
MDKAQRRWSATRVVVLAAIAVGVAAGSYGVASAATGSSSSSGSNAAQSNRQPWGHQRSDETLLTGDTAAKVRALALAKVPGGTVVRVETDADGNAAYEAHMVKADGTPATVYVNKQFEVVSVQTGMPRPPQGGFSPTGSSA